MNDKNKFYVILFFAVTIGFFILLNLRITGFDHAVLSAKTVLPHKRLSPQGVLIMKPEGNKNRPAIMPIRPGISTFKNTKRHLYSESEVLVSFKKEVTDQVIHQVINGHKLNIRKRFSTISKLKGKQYLIVNGQDKSAADLMNELKDHPAVETVALNYARQLFSACEGRYPDDIYFNAQWALCNTGQTIVCLSPDPVDCLSGIPDADIDATEAWSIQIGSPEVIVAVIDTGVDYTHPDLHNNMWINQAEANGTSGIDDDNNGYVDDIYGIDTGEDDSDPMDSMGHGTHMAGIIAAEGDNGEGVSGVAWNAKIMALNAVSPDGQLYTGDILESIDYIIARKQESANIVAINASWGGYECEQILEDAIQAAGDAGIIFVASAGNEMNDNDGLTPVYPASFDLSNIISVAATDFNDELAYFSNYGKISVDLGAPGDLIFNTFSFFLYIPGEVDDLFFDDMESGGKNWKARRTWAITEEQPLGPDPTHVWSDSPGGNYCANTSYALISKKIDLRAAKEPLNLGFTIWFELEEGYDWLVIFYKNPSGSWDYMFSITGTSYNNWFLFTLPIPPEYFWKKFQVKFVLLTDAENNCDGVYLDTIGIGTPKFNQGYNYLGGTSTAAPHVSGALALSAVQYPSEGLDFRIGRILAGVDTLPSLTDKVATGGRLNLYKSLLDN